MYYEKYLSSVDDPIGVLLFVKEELEKIKKENFEQNKRLNELYKKYCSNDK